MRRDRHCGVSGVRMAWHRWLALWKAVDSGSATAEFAVVLPAIVVSAVLLLVLARAGTTAMTCQDAASAGVRSAVISKNDGKARMAARRVAGSDAVVSVMRGGDEVTVTVSCPVAPDPLKVLPGSVKGRAVGEEQ